MYLSLDFETTGLNTAKDDPIQVGLVIFDVEGTIKASYSSLIKPRKSSEELKEIVQYVTGFDISMLQYAPDPKEVFEEVKTYLKEDMILVGHNVGFDLAILKRFISDREPKYVVDTFDCVRQVLHFQQSYALDALIHLDQQQQLNIFHLPTGKAHDALYDATASAQLFCRWMKQVKKITQSQPPLAYLLSKNIVTKDIFEQLLTFNIQLSTSLPPLQASVTTHQKVIKEQKQHVGDSSLHSEGPRNPVREILSQISHAQSPIIVATNHTSKITLIKNILNNQGIQAHDSVHDLPKLNINNTNKFLQKSEFLRPEIGFLIKYFSQYEKGHSLIDCKSVDDYKILNAITDLTSTSLEQVTICTHQHLRSFAKKISPETQIYFLDSDHWLGSYLHHLQQPIDILHMTNLVDQLAYRFDLEENTQAKEVCNTIVTQLCIFSARFHHHIGRYLTGTNVTELECLGLPDDSRDRSTRNLVQEINEYVIEKTEIFSSLPQAQNFLAQRQRIVTILSEPFVIEKKTFNDIRYAVFHAPAHHVSHEDFTESLPIANYQRIHSKQDNQVEQTPSLVKAEGNNSLEKNRVGEGFGNQQSVITLDQNFQSLNTLLHQKNNIFIICQAKNFSKGLFEWMIQQKLDQHFSILAENITGGTGKALLFAKKSKKPIIMIGTENYYYAAMGGSLHFDSIGLWYYKKDHLEQIKADLTFYSQPRT